MTRDDKSLTGKVALVTGGAKGIGMGIAKQLANKGATVVLADIDEIAGREPTELLKHSGTKASFIKADICSEEEIIAAVRHAKEKFAVLDILVNNAGINFHFDATTMTSKD